MKNNSVKYLQGINLSHLTIAKKAGIKNLGRATPDLIISESTSGRIQIYVRKVNHAVT